MRIVKVIRLISLKILGQLPKDILVLTVLLLMKQYILETQSYTQLVYLL
nr:MAG TPA: hypothetical protein [Bacteriophage sp.]